MDTNVVLDWLLDKEDTFAQEATALFLATEESRITIHVLAWSINTIAYIFHRAGKRGQALRSALSNLIC